LKFPAKQLSLIFATLRFSWQQGEDFNRKDWIRFSGWLAAVASVLVYLLASRYLPYIQISQSYGALYLINAYISHFALFPILIGLFVLIPIALALPYRLSLLPIAGSLLFSGLTLLLLDTLIYDQYRFHLSGFIWQLLTGPGAGEIIQLSWLTFLIAGLLLIAIIFIVLLALSIASWCARSIRIRGKGPYLFTIWFLATLISQGMHVWFEAHYDSEVTSITRHLPSYYPLTGKRFLVSNGWLDPDKAREEGSVNTNLSINPKEQGLNYPSSPLQCVTPNKPKNVLVIAIDAMRSDVFSPEITPNLYQRSQQNNALYFMDHHSGGNVTKGGIFSLFYGLPATYWEGFAADKVGSLWIKQHQAAGYELGIFSSATLLSPAFDRTVFASVSNLRLKSTGETPSERDKNAIQDFERFLQLKSSEKPFFSFLFLDAVHGYDVPNGYEKFQPQWQRVDHIKLNNEFNPEPYFNRYKNALGYLDEQLDKLLKKLESQGVLENTLVMITSDHGEEFNDLKQNYWGHGSNFTRHQTQVPLLILWPGKSQQRIDYRTSHYDIAPTIMTEILGCTTPPSNYAIGDNLFDSTYNRDWLLVHSYFNYGIVGNQRIIATYPTGGYEVLDKRNQRLKQSVMPPKAGLQILEQVSRFYQ